MSTVVTKRNGAVRFCLKGATNDHERRFPPPWSVEEEATHYDSRLCPQKEDNHADESNECHHSRSIDWPIGRRCVGLALRAMRQGRGRRWRSRVFVAHGRRRSLSDSASASIANDQLTNKQRNWYRIRVFGDDRHRDDLYTKDIRGAYWFYAKVDRAAFATPYSALVLSPLIGFTC